ncbi:unnamed protein product [Spodoptera littoralis]|uniref:Uncharacterized protein n=1 Tax=Spodoptera littoralis TaxID=7109 RepID=A0A9P0I056_SPOLI|nr:unnamed protein product [Spodoptera littoralis]CAH1636983.1 unnamed protein product [Spodoptera littoralis]
MAVHNYGKYVAVRTFNFDPNDPEKCKCILNNWIQKKDENSDEIIFGYPVENGLHTILRILKSEPLDKSWPTRYGEVIFDSDCQDKVWYFLKLQHREERAREQQEIENEKDSKKSNIPKKGTKTKTSLSTANRRRDKQKQINKKKKIKPKSSKNVLKNINSNLSNISSLPSTSKASSNSQELKKIPDEKDNNRETREQSEQECDTSAQETAATGDTSGHESVVIADTSKQEETLKIQAFLMANKMLTSVIPKFIQSVLIFMNI